jgi:FtsH-binding integral membrane protein
MLKRTAALVACVALTSGCISFTGAARKKRDPLNVVVGLPLDVVAGYTLAASGNAVNGDGFSAEFAGATIGTLVVALFDVLLMGMTARGD